MFRGLWLFRAYRLTGLTGFELRTNYDPINPQPDNTKIYSRFRDIKLTRSVGLKKV